MLTLPLGVRSRLFANEANDGNATLEILEPACTA
jgi:hypothetical protein